MLLAWMFTDLLNSTLATWSFTVCVCVCCLCCVCRVRVFVVFVVCVCVIVACCVCCVCVCVCLCVAGVGLVCWWCEKKSGIKVLPTHAHIHNHIKHFLYPTVFNASHYGEDMQRALATLVYKNILCKSSPYTAHINNHIKHVLYSTVFNAFGISGV